MLGGQSQAKHRLAQAPTPGLRFQSRGTLCNSRPEPPFQGAWLFTARASSCNGSIPCRGRLLLARSALYSPPGAQDVRAFHQPVPLPHALLRPSVYFIERTERHHFVTGSGVNGNLLQYTEHALFELTQTQPDQGIQSLEPQTLPLNQGNVCMCGRELSLPTAATLMTGSSERSYPVAWIHSDHFQAVIVGHTGLFPPCSSMRASPLLLPTRHQLRGSI